MNQLKRVTSKLLNPERSIRSLRSEVVEMTKILGDSQTIWSASKEEMSSGESRTSNGLALSPTMAAMCADGFARTIQFIRGTHDAIVDIRARFPDRPAQVLYVGSGPYATLAVQLMATFSPAEATFTILDIHQESTASAKCIIDTLGLSESVAGYETRDACSYRVCSDQPPDVILIEVLQGCLESEPQVAITRHLLQQAPNAILVPEEVRIDLKMVDPSREFEMTAFGPDRDSFRHDRISVGSVFVVNRDTVSLWEGNRDHRLPGSTVQIPDPLELRFQPMLFTVIRTYKNHILKDYDSGLTVPKQVLIEGAFEPGAAMRFYYELGHHPRLIGEVYASKGTHLIDGGQPEAFL